MKLIEQTGNGQPLAMALESRRQIRQMAAPCSGCGAWLPLHAFIFVVRKISDFTVSLKLYADDMKLYLGY